MSYNQNLASTTKYGAVKVGSGITVTNGIITAAIANNYGFVTSVTTQTNPVASAVNFVTYDAIGPNAGVSVSGGNSIVVANAGTYTQIFTLITNKTSGGTSVISIWLRKNGTDLVGSSQELPLTNNLSAVFVSGNYTLDMAAGDNIQMCWSSADTTTSLTALAPAVGPVRPSGYSAKVTLTRIS
jgi:hypothetical protein